MQGVGWRVAVGGECSGAGGLLVAASMGTLFGDRFAVFLPPVRVVSGGSAQRHREALGITGEGTRVGFGTGSGSRVLTSRAWSMVMEE
ncbi:hypothetical protein NDU88_010971 [Pleurodeles waltl]|uniref:Uncharacterized protein n=1 Tax=Pleurodeles waltl TaxID=8319 RepID=A0AAV7QVW5_PLEWA|nr:hypothetical protein NDU88_010971 [Pleurodeles waltl]